MVSPFRGQSTGRASNDCEWRNVDHTSTHVDHTSIPPLSCFVGGFSKLQKTNTPRTVEGSLYFYTHRQNSEHLPPAVVQCALAERLPIAQALSCAFLLSAVSGGLSMLQGTAGHNGFWFSLHYPVSNSEVFGYQSKDKDK